MHAEGALHAYVWNPLKEDRVRRSGAMQRYLPVRRSVSRASAVEVTSAGFRRPTGLLWPYERPPKSPLDGWASCLIAQLDTAPSSPAATNATVLNQAALIFSHLGHTDVAAAVCHAHIAWVGRFVPSDHRVLAQAIQPWINLGRLDILAGHRSQGRSRLAVAAKLAHHETVELDGCRITPEDWRCLIGTDPLLRPAVMNAYVVDTVESWLATADYAAAMSFVDDVEKMAETAYRRALVETRFLCQIELSEVDAALDVVASASQLDDDLKLALRCHLLHGLIDAGVDVQAHELLALVTQLLLDRNWDTVPPVRLPQFFRLFAAGAHSAERLGADRRTIALGRKLVALATRAGDQVMRINTLQALSAVDGGATGGRYTDLLAEAIVGCDYAAIRRSTQRNSTVPAERPQTYVRLYDRVQTLLGSEAIAHWPEMRLS